MTTQQEAQEEYKRMIGILKERNEDTAKYDQILFGYIQKRMDMGAGWKDYSSVMLEGIPKAFIAYCRLWEYEEAIKDLKECSAAILRGDL